VIEVLLKAGADLNAKPKLGETPLGLAKKHKRDGAEKLLKKSGAIA
jgi:ankyrin repeat protein